MSVSICPHCRKDLSADDAEGIYCEHCGGNITREPVSVVESVYVVTITHPDTDAGRAISRGELHDLIGDHVDKHPHFENYGKISVEVESA